MEMHLQKFKIGSMVLTRYQNLLYLHIDNVIFRSDLHFRKYSIILLQFKALSLFLIF
jgi:hypothetical protein